MGASAHADEGPSEIRPTPGPRPNMEIRTPPRPMTPGTRAAGAFGRPIGTPGGLSPRKRAPGGLMPPGAPSRPVRPMGAPPSGMTPGANPGPNGGNHRVGSN